VTLYLKPDQITIVTELVNVNKTQITVYELLSLQRSIIT